MLFNSYTFWIFFGLVALVYRFLGHQGRNRFLIFSSYVFYGFWDWRFLSLIFLSTAVDFWAGKRIALARDRGNGDVGGKPWLWLSLGTNLGLLAIFKYYGFFSSELNQLLGRVGFDQGLPHLDLILPVGISFYTFQTLSYTIDVFRGRTKHAPDFESFALYVCFFPQLVAGPIERSDRLLPQVVNRRIPLDEIRFREGLYLVLSGLFRKVVVADNMALIANHVFGLPSAEVSAPLVLIGVYAFAFQIYGDFSGYSAIAQGTAKWLGFDLMDNFRQPYFATSPRDFWQRWHISLSTWLRDYLYIPLGGNRSGEKRTHRNLFLTMIIGGLWHGAAWTFVVWGIIHGTWLAVHRALSGTKEKKGTRKTPILLRMAKTLATFHLVCVAWLFFRAESLDQANTMFARLFSSSWGWGQLENGLVSLILFFVGPLLVFEVWLERKKDLLALTRVGWGWRLLGYLFIIGMLIFFGSPLQQEFIYFRF